MQKFQYSHIKIGLKLAIGNQNQSIIEEIRVKLNKAKKIIYLRELELNKNKSIQTKEFINELINGDRISNIDLKEKNKMLVEQLSNLNTDAY